MSGEPFFSITHLTEFVFFVYGVNYKRSTFSLLLNQFASQVFFSFYNFFKIVFIVGLLIKFSFSLSLFPFASQVFSLLAFTTFSKLFSQEFSPFSFLSHFCTNLKVKFFFHTYFYNFFKVIFTKGFSFSFYGL
jgi:hypothetical protein